MNPIDALKIETPTMLNVDYQSFSDFYFFHINLYVKAKNKVDSYVKVHEECILVFYDLIAIHHPDRILLYFADKL
jgi:hypothetical protein